MAKRKGTCRYPGCDNKAFCRGLCPTCYSDKPTREKYGAVSKTIGKKKAAPKKRRKARKSKRINLNVAEPAERDLTIESRAAEGSVAAKLRDIGKRIDVFCDYVDREMKTLKQLLG